MYASLLTEGEEGCVVGTHLSNGISDESSPVRRGERVEVKRWLGGHARHGLRHKYSEYRKQI